MRAVLGLCCLQIGVCQDPFCRMGISSLTLEDDKESPSVDVFVVQAPLYSSNPSVGQRLGLLGMYHTALVLAQGNGTSRKRWTLEFDSTDPSPLTVAVIPDFDGDRMVWRKDARYCLTEGVLWGIEHWSKTFQVAATLSARQVNQLFAEAVSFVNNTEAGGRPQYMMWRVAHTDSLNRITGPPLIEDLTCTDGTAWLLHYIVNTLHVPLKEGFRLRGTTAVVNAESMELVDQMDAALMQNVSAYFRSLKGLIGNTSAVDKLVDAFEAFPLKYVYDTNAGEYYRLVGNGFPWFQPEFVEFPLRPFVRSSPPAPLLLV